MKFFLTSILLLALFCGAMPAGALSVDEIERLKKAGVSDGVIQKMIEQEAAGAAATGPKVETKDKIIYSAGEGNKARLQRNRQHEQYKEKKALDALKGVVIDTRTPVVLPNTKTAPAQP